MSSPKQLGQWTPGVWENVTDLVETGEIIVGGAFTDPAEIERMRRAMRRSFTPPRPRPRRYYPSLMAHHPSKRMPAAS
jgi:hypothetical protein